MRIGKAFIAVARAKRIPPAAFHRLRTSIRPPMSRQKRPRFGWPRKNMSWRKKIESPAVEVLAGDILYGLPDRQRIAAVADFDVA